MSISVYPSDHLL